MITLETTTSNIRFNIILFIQNEKKCLKKAKLAKNPINWSHEVKTEVWTFSMLIFIDLGDIKSENISFKSRTNFALRNELLSFN